jgi:RecT family
MNALAPANAFGLVPTDMKSAMDLATMMSRGKLVPNHLQNSPGDCLMVIEQAMRWGMSPFAVAQSTSVIQGKLMFEGKLVSAALHASGIMDGRLEYDFAGEGTSREVTVRGKIKGGRVEEMKVKFDDAKTTNQMWTKQPDQQLIYFGTRAWARRFASEVMLGVYSPEEFDAPARRDNFTGTTLDAKPEPMTTGQMINDEIPKHTATKRPSIQDWLNQFELDMGDAMAAADPRAAFDALMTRSDVRKAEDSFKNGAKERMQSVIQTAIAQLAESAPTEEV